MDKSIIPEDARKVFEGETLSVYQWEEVTPNGKLKKWEKIRKKNGVAIIPVLDNGKIVLINEMRAGKQLISLPTGGVDFGEDILVAAKRELFEETGYTSDDWELWFTFQKDKYVDSQSYFYIARSCKQAHTGSLGVGDEDIQLNLVAFEDFLLEASKETFRNVPVTSKVLRARLESDEMGKLQKILFNN